MKAIVISESGGPDVLKLEDRPVPEVGDDEVLIKVKAAGINRPDVIHRQGKYPAPPGVPPDIPGLEVAGIIAEIGMNVVRWKIGDPVCALLAGGGYADYVSVPALQCLPVPRNLSFAEAASLPETFFTVWTNIFQKGNFKSGEKVLVHGGSSGIGVAAIQMISAMGGTVIVTAGTPEKCKACEELGAIRAVNYREEDFEEVVKNEVGGVDIVLDMVGGEYTQKNLNCLNTEGRLVIINAMNGRVAEVDLMRIMVKRLIVTGSTLRARDPQFKHTIARDLEKFIWPILESGKIKPVVFRKYPLSEAVNAHRLMEEGSHIGKIILEVD